MSLENQNNITNKKQEKFTPEILLEKENEMEEAINNNDKEAMLTAWTKLKSVMKTLVIHISNQ